MASVGAKLAQPKARPLASVDIERITGADRNFRARRSLFIATDLLGICAGAVLLSNALSAHAINYRYGWHAIAENLGLNILQSGLIVLFGHAQRLYGAYQPTSQRQELWAVLKCILLATTLLACSLANSGLYQGGRPPIFATALCALAWMEAWRYIRRNSIRRALPDGLTCHNVLLVGAYDLTISVRQHLRNNPHLGFVVAGSIFTDQNRYANEAAGSLDELRAICQERLVDEVMICAQDRSMVQRVVSEAHHCGVGIRLIPDLYEGLAWGAHLDYLGGLATLPVVHRSVPALGLKLKRVIDFLILAAAIFLLSPVTVLLTIIIKLDSPGPVFYRSQRVGKKGRLFFCYKFRTMRRDADQMKAKLAHLNERNEVLL